MAVEFTPQLPLTPSAVPGPYRVVDYMGYVGEERIELIHGRLYLLPVSLSPHQIATQEMFVLLRDFGIRTEGVAYTAPFDVVLAEHSVVQPDVVYVAKENRPIVQGCVRGIPDLVVEVLSPSSVRRDCSSKRKLYADCGVPEYWIIDPARKRIEFYVLEGAHYQVVEPVEGVYRSPKRPELEVGLAEYWAEVEARQNPRGAK